MQLGDTPEETRTLWQNLPPLYWMVELGELKPGARVLAEHPAHDRRRDGRRLPLIVMQYVGAGKVLFHATDETWRWRRRVGDVLLRPLLDPDDPLPEPLEAGRGRPLGPPRAPTAASIGRATRCGCRCASPTNGSPRPTTTA